MRIKICIDIWRDVFDWLSPSNRKGFARKFRKIGDREFSDLCQKWLHEWTKNVCLDPVLITEAFENGRASLQCRDTIKRKWKKREAAIAELPGNIGDFVLIRFCYMDNEVLNFLHQMRPLFHNVNLYVDCVTETSLGTTRIALGHLMPLLNSVEILEVPTTQFVTTIHDQWPTLFFGIKVLNVRMWARLEGDGLTDGVVELLLQWLGTRHPDGEPRTLTFWSHYQSHLLIEPIRQQFINATNRASFCVRLSNYSRYYQSTFVAQETIQNAKTNEQLVVRKLADSLYECALLIGRCPAEVNGRKWVDKMHGCQQTNLHPWPLGNAGIVESDDSNVRRRISILDGLEVSWGLYKEAKLRAAPEKKKEDDDEEEDVNQPGPSNT